MPIEKFNIKAFDPDTGKAVFLQAAHSDSLSKRGGYFIPEAVTAGEQKRLNNFFRRI